MLTHPTRAWSALGVGAGLAAVVLVYAVHAMASDLPAAAEILALHRRWPAFLLLDTLPLLLGWAGWLAGSLRESEAALVELAASLGPFSEEALAEVLLDPVLLVEPDGTIVAANTTAAALLEAENLVGTPIAEVLPELGQPPASSERVTRTGRLLGIAWHLTAHRPDGSTFPVRVRCGPAGGQRVIYVLAADVPVPRLDPEREARMQRDQDASRIEARAKSSFLASFARELRARLGRVEAEALQQGGPDDPLTGAARHATSLVDAVADLARIASGRLILRSDAVALQPILNEVLQFGAPLAAARDDVFEVIGPPHLAVRADADRLVQIVCGLVANAVRATRHGRVRIVAGPSPDRPDFHRIEVIDDGTGLLPDQLETLFEDPTRVELGARRRFGGLGLPLAHQLLERMGGSITVRSSFGEGSTFTVHLPAATDVPADPPRVRPGVERLLVIVDRQPEPVRAWLRAELARAGLRSVCWHDGEFPELVALRPWALAIDLDAGDLLLADVLADAAFVGVPVVAATGIVHDRARTLPDGVAALLDAPFDPRELVPSLVLAERAIRGCVLVGLDPGLSELRDGLVAQGWTVLVFGESARAAEAVADRPPALLILVDADPDDPLPDAFAGVQTVYASSEGALRARLDLVALALAGS